MKVLRRIDIGPRLLLSVAVPIAALLTVIALLVMDDVDGWNDLRAHRDATAEIDELIELRLALQEERHRALSHDAPTAYGEPLDVSSSGTLPIALRRAGSSVDAVQHITEARRLVDSEQPVAAINAYNIVIDELGGIIDARLHTAPEGAAARAGRTMASLLDSHEALLQEDLHLRAGDGNRLTLSRLRTEGLVGLDRYATGASPDGLAGLEALTTSSAWRHLTLTDASSFTNLDNPAQLDQWSRAADVRRLALLALVLTESDSLQRSAEELVDSELARLATLATMIGATMAIAVLGAVILRRSIVGPLSTLTIAARSLSNGKIAPVDDPASDEIAEVANAFSTLARTVEHLFSDIDDIADALHDGHFDRRIDTTPLRGDWIQLADMMNATLATNADHHDATREELDRRAVMTEISNAAVMSTSASEITATILHHLPKSIAGAHAHLHEHPSGPPEFDLGITLEPPFSALEIPTMGEHAHEVTIDRRPGVASLVEFPTGPPAVLTLMFGKTEPAQLEPLVSLVETSARILAQAHRRQIAETDATHSREHDLLTGMANSSLLHRWFDETANGQQWTAIGVAPLDLDDLDGTFGRDARNLVLRAVAEKLDTTVTELTTSHGTASMLARVEEPEFVAVVPATLGELAATTIAREFSEPLDIDGTALTVNVSIGVDHIGGDDTSSELTRTLTNVATAIRRADGRTTEIIHFEERYREDVRRRTQLIRWLGQAIENRDLTIAFQPVVNAVTTQIEGYECLVRGSMDGEPVSPAEFIPLAEETNMITAIGEFTLREACAALPFLRGDTPYVAVNLSPIELSDPHLLDRIDNVLTRAAVDRRRVVFEITEGATTTESDVELLRRLHRLGVRIAIDDFGSGQSNLSYLNTLPAQILKLDRSLVTPMVDDPGAASVVRKAIEMAHDLGMTVVGEGVETNEELNALRRMRCDRIQGWLTGRPAPLEEFIEITVDRPITQISTPTDTPQ